MNHRVYYNQNLEQFYIKVDLEVSMHIKDSGDVSPVYLRRSSINGKAGLSSHSYLQKGKEDIYLNIEMPAIFTPSRERSLKTFNRRLQQSLKEREMQQIMQKHNNRMANNTHKTQISPKTKTQLSEKVLIIDDTSRNQTKSLFSMVKKKDTRKKYSLDMKYETPERKSIFNIPIKEASIEQNNIFRNLIASQSSKGLIERLLRSKKIAKQEQEQTKCVFRYPLNRKIFNKVSKKSHNIKGSRLLITFEQKNVQQVKQVKQKYPQDSPKEVSFKRITRYNNKNLILSPSNRKQWHKQVKLQPRNTVKNIIEPTSDVDEIGPWRQQGHTSFDI